MNKNIDNVVELTEKELACVCGGLSGDQHQGFEWGIKILEGFISSHGARKGLI